MNLLTRCFCTIFSIAVTGHALAAVVDIVDNVPLTAKKIVVSRPSSAFGLVAAGIVSIDGDDPFVNTIVKDGIEHKEFSTVQITAVSQKEGSDEKRDEYDGTGFFAIDRTRPIDGIYSPVNLTLSPAWSEPAHPRPRNFLLTNRHVLNLDEESNDEDGEKWIKSFYRFDIHLMKTKAKHELGVLIGIGQFKTAHVTVPLADLEIHHPDPDITIMPGTDVSVDLAAINIQPIFTAIRNKIAGEAALTGYAPFYFAFDALEHFSKIPAVETPVHTYGYPVGMKGGGMLALHGFGRVAGDLPTVEDIDGKGEMDVVDGYFALDIPGGASGSPVYYFDEHHGKEKVKLAGVAFASDNEETHRVGRVISAQRAKTLLSTFA